MIKGAIFDMDGTLLDSMFMWKSIGESYLSSIGLSPKPDLRENLVSLTLAEACEFLKDDYGLSCSGKDIAYQIDQMISESYRSNILMKDGVPAVLQELKDRDIKMCIATATDRHHTEAALERLNILHYFQGIITSREAGRGKNWPDIYLQAAEMLGTSPEETLVFEDAVHAAKTAKDAGFIVVAVEDNNSQEYLDQLKEASHLYLTSFKDFNLDDLSVKGKTENNENTGKEIEDV